MSVYDRISDRTQPRRPHETVYTTVHEVYFTSELIRAHTVLYDAHTTNTVPLRIIHAQIRSDAVEYGQTQSQSISVL